MRNPLQDQLLKAGLVKKSKVAEVARQQEKLRHGKAPATTGSGAHVERLQAERAERDRALSAERNAQARARELKAQVRQMVDGSKVERKGEIAYRFPDGDGIRSVWVDAALRGRLAAGGVVIVRVDEGYEVVPREAAEKIRTRYPDAIVLDHGGGKATDESDDDAAHYAKFQVPDDLTW